MNKVRIAARVAAYMYSDGLPYDGPELHKSIAEIYAEHATPHKIDLSKLANYSDSAKGVEITRERAMQELKDHDAGDPDSIASFLTEVGDQEVYDASAVLDWLGY